MSEKISLDSSVFWYEKNYVIFRRLYFLYYCGMR